MIAILATFVPFVAAEESEIIEGPAIGMDNFIEVFPHYVKTIDASSLSCKLQTIQMCFDQQENLCETRISFDSCEPIIA